MSSRTLVVAGHGMVGHKLLEELVARGATDEWDVHVFAEERHFAYDRVRLSSLFSGATADDLSLVNKDFLRTSGCTIHLGEPVAAVDRTNATVTTSSGRVLAYDALVFATGSLPFVPPLPGTDAAGCFVYRTIDDLDAIAAFGGASRVGAVIGGGLLGLEAANALLSLGLETHVLELAPRLMPVQVDDGGGRALRRRIERLGVLVHTDRRTEAIVTGDLGEVRGIRFADGEVLPVDIVVFSAGIRPRDELAGACGLELGMRGGIAVDDRCRTVDPRIFAVGECTHVGGRTWGLVAPGYEMARVVAAQLCGEDLTFIGGDLSTKLKLLGVDVATFGDAFGSTDDCEAVTYADPVSDVYRRIVVDPDGPRVLGGILVGDALGYDALLQMARGDRPTPRDVSALVVPAGAAPTSLTGGVTALADAATICSCNAVSKGELVQAVAAGATDLGALKSCTRAGTGCGGCVPMVDELLHDELQRAGVSVARHVCEHFPFARQELYDIVRARRIRSFSELLAEYGRGLGCEICKPAVASMLASESNGHILDGEQASLQDTNDHFLANLQRNGTYSVVPRVPGGEITPEQLIAIGDVAKEFGLYTKITGGQRIDMFGARVEQLPAIWRRLVDVGLESGHAYGKALRTVKSCVGHAWCRYGVQDSTSMAIRLELRYRGLRAPHKIKMAVSGCIRECAEAQGKDVGVIATERGWNVYVAGNGGARPQHAVLFANDLDDETLLRYIDRFLIFYIRTADRLERTASWFNKLDGGIDYLRRVIIDDALGICAELDAAMARHVANYECEWRATLASPERMARFRTFVNSDAPDPTVVVVTERGQPRPARADEVPVELHPTRQHGHFASPTTTTAVDTTVWVEVCALDALEIGRGVAALVDGDRVAVFRVDDGDTVFAISNDDPFSGASVMSRGIVGSRGDTFTVASPVYKQRFDLATGRCLDDPDTALTTYPVRIVDGRVQVVRQ